MAPCSGSEFDLLKGEWIRLTDPVRRKPTAGSSAEAFSAKKKDSPYNELMNTLEDFNQYISSMKSVSNDEIRKMIRSIRALMH